MFRRISSIGRPCIVFLSAHTFLGHKVRPCALNTGRHNRLVVVNSYLIFGSSFYHFPIVTYTILTVVSFFKVHQTIHISRFHDMHSILLIESEGFVQLVLVVAGSSCCFMMSNQFYAFLTGIISDCLNIKIRIRFGEV